MPGKIMQPITKFHLIESAFLLSVPLFAYVAETVCGPGTNHWSPWHWVALVYALYCVHLGFFYRRKLMMKAKAALAAKPSDKKALKKWEASQVVPLCFAQHIALTAAVIRLVLHGTLWQAAPFYVSALALILLWSPQEPHKAATAVS
jgi:hypothetical protein